MVDVRVEFARIIYTCNSGCGSRTIFPTHEKKREAAMSQSLQKFLPPEKKVAVNAESDDALENPWPPEMERLGRPTFHCNFLRA